MSDNGTERRLHPLTRRAWMKAAGAGTVASLAGCFSNEEGNGDGGGNGGGDSSNGGGDGRDGDDPDPDVEDEDIVQEVDHYYVVPAIGNMEQVNYNVWSLDPNMFYQPRMLWDGLAHWSPETQQHYPELATDWEFNIDNEVVTIELRDDIQWHDGTDYTADHAVDHFKIAETQGFPPWEFAEDVHAPEEYVLEFDIDPAAESMMVNAFLGTNWVHWLWTHHEHHREFIERYEDGEDHEEISADLGEFEISGEEAAEQSPGMGPMALVEVTNSRAVMHPYEPYPAGEIGDSDDPVDLNYGIEVIDFGDAESDFHEAAIADNIDGFTGTTSEEVRNQMGDHWDIIPTPQVGHAAIIPSPDSVWGQDTEESRALRQAIAYFFDPSEYVAIFGEDVNGKLPDPNNVTGLNTSQANAWLDDVIDDFTNYGNSEIGWVQEDMAEQKMREAGYERDGDTWVDADSGDPLEVSIPFPVDWTANHPAYNNVAEQFRRFGINAEARGEDNTTLFTQTLPDHDFELAISLTSLGPHPLQAYETSFGNISDPDGTRYNNQLSEVTVPMPVGDPDGSLETVSIDDRINQLSASTDENEVQKLVEELAWIWNQWVNNVQCYTGIRTNYVAHDNWQWDIDQDDGRYVCEQPWTYLTRTGHLNPDF